MVPVLVAEMVPVLVAEMVPDLANAVMDIAKTNIAVQTTALIFFMIFSWWLNVRGLVGLEVVPARAFPLKPTL
jgi:hypothetical protein